MYCSTSFLCHLGVMPPDEYYSNVSNSVYTNTVAKFRYLYLSISIIVNLEIINASNPKSFSFFSLQFAVELAALLQHPAPKEWQEVAERLKIPFDQESQYHPEYDGYIKG